MNTSHLMTFRFKKQQILLLAALFCLPLAAAGDVAAQGNCVSFGQARQQGLFAQFNLRPAGAVKNEVEARTGGKVVGFKICRPGPNYVLTVLHPGGRVETISVPAR